jgi:hypothetical protein
LRLDLRDPGWIGTRFLDDLIPDHGHLMHLFIVSPSLDDRIATLAKNTGRPEKASAEIRVIGFGHADEAGVRRFADQRVSRGRRRRGGGSLP